MKTQVVFKTDEGARVVLMSAVMGIIDAMSPEAKSRTARSILGLLRKPPDSFRPIPADATHDIDAAIALFEELGS